MALTEWNRKTIKNESDLQLAQRLRNMSHAGETMGRIIALREAAKRLKRLYRIEHPLPDKYDTYLDKDGD